MCVTAKMENVLGVMAKKVKLKSLLLKHTDRYEPNKIFYHLWYVFPSKRFIRTGVNSAPKATLVQGQLHLSA